MTDYYGTGHFSMDNYISLVSGQSPSYGVQDDCSGSGHYRDTNSAIITKGRRRRPPTPRARPMTPGPTDLAERHRRQHGNPGQLLVHGGVDAAPCGNNGCVYPTDVDTLFNQLNPAGAFWKGYAQDLGGEQPMGSTRAARVPRRGERHRCRTGRRGLRYPGLRQQQSG